LFEVRDLWPAFAVAVGVLRSKVLISASEWLERFLYRHADRVLVNSPGFVTHVRARGAREVRLVPNGVDTEMFDPDASGELFRRNHALESKYVIMYAGAHGMSNDLDVALEAAAILRDEVGIAFVFVGDGKEKPRLVAEAERLDLNNVHFISPVPKTSMGAVLAGANACLAILKPVEVYKTVYPNKVFDYMAAAKPVILAIDGVIREVVENAGAGVYTPPGDSYALAQVILALYRDPESALVMGKRGRALVTEHFDRRILARRLGELITEMGAANKKSPRGLEN
jgi:glycosyltransferase involved in cell wall biosynthesis